MAELSNYTAQAGRIGTRDEAMKFYVYMWLRKNGTPYYIGKGVGPRGWVDGSRSVTKPKDVDRIIIQEYDSEDDAYNAETFFIDFYGRKCEEGGILYNARRGGGKISQPTRCRNFCDASLDHCISFKAATWMRDRLRALAASERRKVGDMIRILLERQLNNEKEKL